MSREVTESVCSSITAIAEAVFFLFKTGESLLDPTVRLLIANGVCLQENHNDTQVCQNLSMFKDNENHVQSVSAYYLASYKLVLNLPTLLLAIFCGAWSDQIGRRTPIVMSSIGTIISIIFYISGRFMMATAAAFFTFVFLAAALRGVSGKALMQMAIESFIADVSSRKARTQNLSKILSMSFFGYFLGSMTAGVLLQFTDFAFVFAAVILFNAICIFLTVVFMKESVSRDDAHSINQHTVDSDESTTTRHDSWKSKNPFRWTHVKESLQVIVKPRANHNRAHLLFFFFVIFTQQTLKSGDVDVTVLYTKKSPLSWPGSTYGYFIAVDYACLGISSAFIAPFLVRCLNVKDTTLCIIGITCKIARLAMMSYGRYTWLIFLSVVVGSPSAFIVSSGKSMISKLVAVDEIGKAFSLLTFCETVANFVGSAIFSIIYATTLRSFAGLVYVIQACLLVLLLFAVVLLICDQRRLEASQSYTTLDERFVTSDDDKTSSDAVQLTTNDALSSYGTIDQSSQSDR